MFDGLVLGTVCHVSIWHELDEVNTWVYCFLGNGQELINGSDTETMSYIPLYLQALDPA